MHEAGTAPDSDLVRSYAREGSETAFRALVGRHVNLVFATACRQVGDPGLAEEITQNVFVSLARKAPRLAGHATIAGWLHRTATLEAKARFRAEMRRRRREEIAATLAESQPSDPHPLEEWFALLDEALLHLRESDRLALVLRFLEERSLREVGSALGIDEDAARKRVRRALERVTEFFRRRGLTLPAGASTTALLGQTAKAAPTALAASAASAGIAAGHATSGLNLLLLHLMTLSKSQTALVCVALAVAPYAWHASSLAQARDQHQELARLSLDLQTRAAAVDAENARLEQALLEARNATANARAKAAQLANTRPASPARPAPTRYRWDDQSPVARIPKMMLRNVEIQGVSNQLGELSPDIQGALQFTELESQRVQAALDRFVNGYHQLLTRLTRRVEPTPEELQNLPPDQVRVFEVQGLADPVNALRQEFLADLAAILQEDRLQILLAALESWMGGPDQQFVISSSQAIYSQDHRFRLADTGLLTDSEPRVGYGVHIAKRGSFYGSTRLAELPEFLRPEIQPWLDAARAKAAAAAAAATAQPTPDPASPAPLP